MKSAWIGLWILALASASQAHADPFPATAENFFKWGEYDSLTHVLEKWLTDIPEAGPKADTPSMAKANLYLGVAYYTAGKMETADRAFARAWRLNGRIRPDQFYVSEDIASHFDRVADREKEKMRRDSLSRASAPPTTPGGFRPASRGHAWIGWTAGGIGLAAAGTAVYFLYFREPDAKPKETVSTVKVP